MMYLIGIIVCFLTALFLLMSIIYLLTKLGPMRPAAVGIGLGNGGIPAGYGLEGLAGLEGGGFVSVTQTYSPLYDDFAVNAGPNIDIAATTALGVTARLSTYCAPVEIVSGDCVVGGSLPAGSVSPPFTFILRVDRGARPGIYALPLTVTYKHVAGEYDLRSAFGGFACHNNYVEDCVTLPIYVVIREAFDLVVGIVALLGLLYAGRSLLKKRPGNKPPQALPPATIPEKK